MNLIFSETKILGKQKCTEQRFTMQGVSWPNIKDAGTKCPGPASHPPTDLTPHVLTEVMDGKLFHHGFVFARSLETRTSIKTLRHSAHVWGVPGQNLRLEARSPVCTDASLVSRERASLSSRVLHLHTTSRTVCCDEQRFT